MGAGVLSSESLFKANDRRDRFAGWFGGFGSGAGSGGRVRRSFSAANSASSKRLCKDGPADRSLAIKGTSSSKSRSGGANGLR